MNKFLISSALLLISFVGFSQTKGISYQAVIIDPNPIQIPGSDITAQPYVSKDVWIRFGIYAGTTLQYEELHKTKTDEYGLVNLVIGAGVNTGKAGTFTSLSWDGVTKNILTSVSFDQGGRYTDVSNQKLTYTPYTLLAETAVKLAGVLPIASGGTGATNAIAARTNLGLGNVDNTADADKPVSIATLAILDTKEAMANKSTNIIADSASSVKYPSVKAIKEYIDSQNSVLTQLANQANRANLAAKATALETPRSINGVPFDGTANITIPVGVTPPDANATTKGLVQLAGDLTGTAAAPSIAAASITTAKIIDGAVTTGKLAAGAVNTAQVADGAVTDAKIVSVSGSKVTGNIAGNAANVSGMIAVANGGTGATTAAGARTNLGLVIGTDVMAANFTTTLTGDVMGSGNGSFTTTVNQVGGVSSSTITALPGLITSNSTSIAANTASITANSTDIATINTNLVLKAPLASPAFTGTPTAPTPATSDNSTKVATTEYVQANLGTVSAGTLTGTTLATTITGSSLTSVGTITSGVWSATTIDITKGGTGATTAAGARTNLGLGVLATNSTIVDADIDANAAIQDTKLATILTAGKVSNSATTATTASTSNSIVLRDVYGSFAAGEITAAGLNSSGNINVNGIKIGTPGGASNIGISDAAFNWASPVGNGNTVLGNYAFTSSSGSSNTAIGHNSIRQGSGGSGNNNTAVGSASLSNGQAANNNTAIGSETLNSSTGIDNTALGYYSGRAITTGTKNTFLGSNADASANNLENASAIGYGAVVDGSNKIQLGNANVTSVVTSGTISATGFTGPLTGNASTATKLAATKTINGVAFDGSADITIAANSNTLTGTTLASTITGSSLTSVGTITSGVWSATTIDIAKGGTGATSAAAALTNLGAEAIANKSISIATDATSDDKYPSVKSVKTYVDGQLASGGVADLSITNAKLAGSITSSKLVGTDITTVGTITTGTWSASVIDIAHGGTGSSTVTGAKTNLGLNNVENTALSTWTGSTNITTVGALTAQTKTFMFQDLILGYGANNQAKIQTDASNKYLSFYPNYNVESTRMWPSGNVTIQTGGTFTDNGYKLEVAGTSKFTGNASIVGNLDVTGNITSATWSGTTIGIANGGTGSTTKNFVDLTTTQTIAGAKTFSSDLTTNGIRIGVGRGSGTSNYILGNLNTLMSTTGSNNMAFGDNTGMANTSGLKNLAIGSEAFRYNTTGSENVGIGFSSLRNNLSGSFNTAIGVNANSINTTGSYLTAIGYGADFSSVALTNATAIGNGAIAGASNTIQLGNTSVTSVVTSGTVSATGFTGPLTGNASTATALATGRTISVSGDIDFTTGTFDGITNATASATLTNTSVTAGTYGSSTAIPTFTVDSKGRLTAASTVGITAGVSTLAYSTTGASNGGTISGTTLTLTAADASNPGLISTGTQTIAGAKTFTNTATFNTDITVNGLKVGRGAGAVASNAALGVTALNANTSGNYNVAVGSEALQRNTDGSVNVALGAATIDYLISGNNNTAVGGFAGRNYGPNGGATGTNTTMNNGILLGYDARPLVSGGTDEVVIGMRAIGHGSNTVTLGNSNNTKTFLTGDLSLTGNITSGIWSATEIAIAKGGTGATTASGARTNLGLGSLATKSAIVNADVDASAAIAFSKLNITRADISGLGIQDGLTAGSGISLSSGTISVTGLTTSNLASNAAITNAQLANSSTTLGSTTMTLGGTITSVTGLSSVTSTGFTGALTGNASTATKLAATKNINGVAFDGSADITIAANANTLTGTTLASNVVTSSLTSVGTITSGTWSGTVIGSNVGGAGSVNGLLKANGAGVVSAAVAGTDYLNPSTSNIKIGYVSGGGTQGAHSIAIGSNAAQSGTQAEAAVAIGYAAGQNGQGANSVAIGAFAGNSQGANSIALNASGNALSPTSSGFYVDPVNNASTSSFMFYNTTTKEISYSAIPTLNQNTTGNATTATTAGNITATSNTTLTSLANLATVGTITQGTWSGTTIAVANGGTGTTTSTGSGSLVLNTSPTLVTPILGTPSSVTLTNGTGLPISTGVSGLGTGVATFLATPTSANLLAAVTDETGTGALVFANTPTLITPVIGAATGTSLSLSGNLSAAAGTFSTTLTAGATTVASLVSPSITGGSGTTQTLTYKTTSGVGTTGADHIFLTGNNGGTEALRITNAGNVGVGTNTPTAKLDVAVGTTTNVTGVNLTGSINDFLQFNVQNTSTGNAAQSGFNAVAENGTATTKFAWMGINNSTVTSASAAPYNIGLGNDVSFMGSGNDMYLANANSTKSIIFSTGTGSGTAPFFNERMRITSSGNVGIGTASPTATLEVNGTTRLGGATTIAGAATFTSTVAITTGAAAGKVLTSDASGNATWQTGVTTLATKTVGYTLTLNDNYIIMGTTAATGQTFTLPTAVGCAGKEFTIKNLSAYSVAIATTSSQYIVQDNLTATTTSATIGIEPANNWIKVISDGTSWIAFRALF